MKKLYTIVLFVTLTFILNSCSSSDGDYAPSIEGDWTVTEQTFISNDKDFERRVNLVIKLDMQKNYTVRRFSDTRYTETVYKQEGSGTQEVRLRGGSYSIKGREDSNHANVDDILILDITGGVDWKTESVIKFIDSKVLVTIQSFENKSQLLSFISQYGLGDVPVEATGTLRTVAVK